MAYHYVGKSIPRIESVAKVTGEAKFSGDLEFPGMLYGKVLRSPLAHAYLKKIDVGKARELAGVKAVITYQDVPANRYTSTGHPHPDDTPRDMRILDNKVRYVGDAVAAVAAESAEIAARALELIAVEYEEIPAVFTAEEALLEGAPEIHDGTHNIAGQSSYEIGDVEQGFALSDYVIEDTFKTPIVTHCPLENHVSLVCPESDGRLTVYSATHVPHILRRILGVALGISLGKIRVIKTYVGGGFGGKQDVVQEPLNAALALAAGRPVLLEYTREEELAVSRTRHSMTIKCKTGVTREGRILARQMQVLSNTGAYSSHGHSVALNMGSQFSPLYPTPNLRFEATTVYTNLPVAGAMRGYGIPQLDLAMESHLDNIAGKLQLDPIEFRLQNLCKVGDYDENTGITINSCGLREILDKGKLLSRWNEKRTSAGQAGTRRKGLGMACFSYAQSCYPHQNELSAARVMLNEDGSATLFLGASDIGQGSDTVFAQMAAEELGIPLDTIKVVAVDTDVCPFDLGAYASRQTYVTGMAVKKAAAACKRDILNQAGQILHQPADVLDTSEGWIVARANEERLLPISEVTMQAFYDLKNPLTITHDAYYAPECNALSFGATFAEVEVDLATGKIEVLQLWNLHDSGKIINPQAAAGQVHGGAAMSFAYGVMEQILVDPQTGRVLNNNLLDYKMPTIMDVPPIEAVFVETFEPSSAFGNKSLGEPPNLTPAPAIRNAVLHATGIGFGEIPLTPEKVLQKLLTLRWR